MSNLSDGFTAADPTASVGRPGELISRMPYRTYRFDTRARAYVRTYLLSPDEHAEVGFN